ncbi:MAG: bifunctional response regulator/alkaline phosphatase family protein [Cytophagales bacterium]|nr:PglZ domain-containing protein [Bernardetiaceae bacterium]MDW8209918.1 bifunctional response regulator/alkaline phosphatase family protein [Cytophagales bacterium]
MQRYSILWADDEIELLKPYILFLSQKGYDVTPVNSGADALEKFATHSFDVVFLDENMPGMSGLETLSQMKTMRPHVPIVMITKSEEESIMEEAIGSKIDDYLIKPVNPSQIILSIKKLLDQKRIISEKITQSYQQDFRNIMMAFSEELDHQAWTEVYKKLIYWELEIENSNNQSMSEVLQMQKSEANTNFAKFVMKHYEDWLNDPEVEKPLMSHQLLRKKLFPKLNGETTFFLLIDNLRYDQWKALEPLFTQYFNIEQETAYYSILPTTTAFARNAIFAGVLPTEIEKIIPQFWKDDEDEGAKNNNEKELLQYQLKRNRLEGLRFSYHKVIHHHQGKGLVESFNNLLHNQLNVIVYNFVDMLSHARTDTEMIRELAPDEAAYRSITRSWFAHSPVVEMVRRIAEKKCRLVITTDHGTIRTTKPYRIIGDKNTNTNLRYKQGKSLDYDPKYVFVCKKPEALHLPRYNVSTSYVFATEDYFFAYPNNFNHYVKYYKDTFQHGGISLEEMIIPYVALIPK